ncbi:fibronectin type III-like domain-contianing protein, partial [Candidatus Izimaplasma bacterium]|nr:fibronectin type III-like domain-contianing protein [Candidatus Izimaplasma bacterium]
VFNVIKKFDKNVIVILSNGSALNITPLLGYSNAVIEAWFLGNANAKPLVDVLTGIVNPSGRLSETFPLCIENTPLHGLFPSKEDSVSYVGDIVNTGYRYYDTHKHEVRYPFGFGLSYSDFNYDSITVNKKELSDGDSVQVEVQITNTSVHDGYEVVQVYIHDKESYLSRPYKELKGFKKVFIKAKETVKVTIELDERAFAVYSVDFKDFRVETGEFDILVGKNANEIVLQETICFISRKPFRSNQSIYHTVKYFKLHNREKFDIVVKKYRDFPWYEIEEPTIRVFKRLKREFKINDADFEELLTFFVN